MTYTLDEKWSYNTKSHIEFSRLVNELDNGTQVVSNVRAADMEFICLREIEEGKNEAAANIVSESTLRELENVLTLNRRRRPTLHYKSVDADVVREAFVSSRLLLKIGNKVCALANGCKTELCRKAGIKGEFLNSKSIALPMAVIDGMTRREYSHPEGLKYVMRRNPHGNIYKIFGVYSNDTSLVSMRTVLDNVQTVLECADFSEYGPEVVGGYVDHAIVSERIEFRSLSEKLSREYGLRDTFYIGISFQAMQTGDCAREMKGTLRLNDSDSYITLPFPNGSVVRQDANGIVDSDSIRELVNYLASIVKKVAGKQGLVTSMEEVDSYMNASALKPVIGKARTRQQIDSIAEKCTGREITQYDLLCEIMTLPTYVDGVCPYTSQKVRDICGDIIAA